MIYFSYIYGMYGYVWARPVYTYMGTSYMYFTRPIYMSHIYMVDMILHLQEGRKGLRLPVVLILGHVRQRVLY